VLLDLFFKSKIGDTGLEVLTACLYPTSSPKRANYLRGIGERRVAPTTDAIGGLKALAVSLPDSGASPDEILALLDNVVAET
jgi:hypothetical protein